MWNRNRLSVGRGMTLAAVAGVFALVVLGCSESGDTHAAESDPGRSDVGGARVLRITPEAIAVIGLRTETAARGRLRLPLQVSGRVTYDENRFAQVSAPIAGRVQSFRATIGDRVKQGEPLAFIESPDIGRAQSDYLRAMADRDVAERAFERAKVLFEKKGVSRGEVQRLEGDALRARAAVQEAKHHLSILGFSDEAVAKLGETGTAQTTMPLVSPLSGVVVRHEAFTGAGVEPTQMLYLVADLSEVWVEADVYERDIARVKPGQDADIRVQAYPDRVFSGRVETLGRALDEKTRTLMVRVVVPNRDEALKPGMLAQVGLLTDAGEEALTVSADAVQRDGERSLVFVEQAPGVFAIREVTVGRTAGGRVEIRTGVDAGEKVVTTGSFRLKSEMKKTEMEAG
ncbi:MAG: efflux RND transporter periplasmic adaptor subunit [Nitrospirota bacterium]